MRRFQLALATGIFIGMFAGCARAPIKSVSQAMRPTEMPSLADDLSLESLTRGLEKNIDFLDKKPEAQPIFRFGERSIPVADYLKALRVLVRALKSDPTGEHFRKVLQENFEAYEVYGQDRWGEVFITSYFEPVIKGALRPTKKFTQPIYGVPKDLVDIDLASFVSAKPTLASVINEVGEQRSRQTLLRGRLGPPVNDSGVPRITAYPDRKRIDGGEIKGQAKVLAYVDPIDAFILEIQGSGVIELPNRRQVKVGYAAQNGHPYVSIGKYMFEVIPREKMSLQAIESHLRSLPPEDMRRYLHLNPSYVFFRKIENRGITYMGTELITGRTIATDPTYFPKGALAFLEFEKPVFDSDTAIEAKEWAKASRFVIDQDTGGAIRGPHRVDLFAGRGNKAKQFASVMKNKGRLIYFVPKAEFLSGL